MKKRIFLALLATASMMAFSGCGLKQTEKKVTIEAGEEFAFQPEDFFSKIPEDAKPEDFLVDLGELDTTKPGEYEVKVTYDNKEYTIKVNVEDTIAPKVGDVETIITNDLPTILDKLTVEIEDATKTTVVVEAYEKVSELTTDYEALVEEALADENVEEREEIEPKEDGIYTAVLTVEDLGENKTQKEIAIVYDTTAPQLYLGETSVEEMGSYEVEQTDLTAQPEYGVGAYQFVDALDGNVTEAVETSIELTDEAKHIWTVTAKTKDTAGNEGEYTYTITVVEKGKQTVKPPTADSVVSGANLEGNASETGNTNTTANAGGNSNAGNGSASTSTGGSTGTGNSTSSGSSSTGGTSKPETPTETEPVEETPQESTWSYEARRAQFDYGVETETNYTWYYFGKMDGSDHAGFQASLDKFCDALNSQEQAYTGGPSGIAYELTTEEDLEHGCAVAYFSMIKIDHY